jgi:hypothetical protein
MTGSEAIKIAGGLFVKDFELGSEELRNAYRLCYENFIVGLDGQNKGLAITGSIGCGKTVMMKVLQKLFKDSPRAFRWVNSGTLRDMLDEGSLSQIKDAYGYDCKIDLYIDDVGHNLPATVKYGNVINVVAEIIMERYDLFINEGYKTHISTNLLPKLTNNPNNQPTLETFLGNRCYDRIKEMNEFVTINSKSLRK